MLERSLSGLYGTNLNMVQVLLDSLGPPGCNLGACYAPQLLDVGHHVLIVVVE